MSDSILTKDPTRLRCPNCGQVVDAGHSWRAVKGIWKNSLACEHCGIPLKKKSRSYWALLPVILAQAITHVWKIAEPYESIISFGGLALSFFLIGKEIGSARLEVRDEEKDQ